MASGMLWTRGCGEPCGRKSKWTLDVSRWRLSRDFADWRKDSRLTVRGFRDLVAWQRSVDLVEHIYRITGGWPKAEIYGLTNQIRRAAVSVPANIAEGQGRSSRKEFAHHVAIAYGSLCEVETHVIIANRLAYIDSETCDDLIVQTTDVARPLHGLMQSLQKPMANVQRPTTNDQGA